MIIIGGGEAYRLISIAPKKKKLELLVFLCRIIRVQILYPNYQIYIYIYILKLGDTKVHYRNRY